MKMARKVAGRYQRKVARWICTRFGRAALTDERERGARVVEECCELAQSSGMSFAEVVAIATHVYAQPIGVIAQEAAGTVVALLAFAEAYGFDLFEAMDREVKRILHVPLAISRQKQTFKANAGIARLPGTQGQET